MKSGPVVMDCLLINATQFVLLPCLCHPRVKVIWTPFSDPLANGSAAISDVEMLFVCKSQETVSDKKSAVFCLAVRLPQSFCYFSDLSNLDFVPCAF